MRLLALVAVLVAIRVLLPEVAVAAPSTCEQHFDSTFDLIQSVIFEGRGCTSANCHSGALPAGGLDLSADVAYGNLVDHAVESVPPDVVPGLARVTPGSKGRSLLWLNLAAATLPDQWRAALRPMPQGGLPPLTLEELDLIRTWIEHGASRDGIVPGSGDLFDACLPPPVPIKVKPLDSPAPGTGVQLRAPQQELPPQTERETCFVSYFDVSAQVPEEFRGPNGDTFRYKLLDARQDPLSHHAVVDVYSGHASIDDPVWGPFTCKAGSRAGAACQPTDLDSCGSDGICASPPVKSVTCIGYGPGDAFVGTGPDSLFATMGSPAVNGVEGIYAEAPLRGILVWDSHAFNVTDTPATLDMWLNFIFAAPEEQLHPLERFIDSSAVAKMVVPAFGAEEVCQRYVLPPGARLIDLTSHTHKRGKRFRIFEGAFSCESGPHAGDPCSPFGPDPGLPVPDLCAGAPCSSLRQARVGDCDRDGKVTVDELVVGLNIALGHAPVQECASFDRDDDAAVRVDELLAAIDWVLNPMRDPNASLLYTNLTYSDPPVVTFDPPLEVGGDGAPPSERTLTYCSLYDNGFTDPNQVKRRSRLPSNASPCIPTHCVEGAVGKGCSTDLECDSAGGAGDGWCDACTVQFGLTTDDEMFVLAGSLVRD